MAAATSAALAAVAICATAGDLERRCWIVPQRSCAVCSKQAASELEKDQLASVVSFLFDIACTSRIACPKLGIAQRR